MRRPSPTRYRLRYESCGRPACRLCSGRLLAHGPHWQAAVGTSVRRWRSIAVTGNRPRGITAAQEAALRLEAERDRRKRENAAESRKARKAARTATPQLRDGHVAAALRTDFARLGLSWDADGEAVKRAYRELSLQHHPDRQGGSHDVMAALNQAYDRLSAWFAND